MRPRDNGSVECDFSCPSDHPAVVGHFPGRPIVPGAMLLSQAAILARREGGWRVTGVRKARFKKPLLPETTCRIRLSMRQDGALDLMCWVGDSSIMVAILDCTEAVLLP